MFGPLPKEGTSDLDASFNTMEFLSSGYSDEATESAASSELQSLILLTSSLISIAVTILHTPTAKTSLTALLRVTSSAPWVGMSIIPSQAVMTHIESNFYHYACASMGPPAGRRDIRQGIVSPRIIDAFSFKEAVINEKQRLVDHGAIPHDPRVGAGHHEKILHARRLCPGDRNFAVIGAWNKHRSKRVQTSISGDNP